MKLTKKLEAEILSSYHAYWDAYLRGDMKTFASYLDDNISVYGTAIGEVFKTKGETIKFYKATAHQMTGKADFHKRKIKIHAVGDTVVINEQCDLYVLAEKKWTFYGHVRVTAIFEQKGNVWKIIHQHASFPDSRTEEGDQIATEKIKSENLQLREAVNRRTVELQEKNWELEIETALEKVRAIAMGMNQPADMLDVCQTISLQLQSLGLKNIRNVQTAIFYPARGTYMNYEYYARHRKTFITEVDYTDHKVAKAFAAKMLKGKGEVSVTHINGPKVKQWLAYQKGTNVFIDKYLQKADSLHYYWHSLGSVALGISSYSLLSKEDLVLFRRFLNVFELSYKRHLDIEQALAQAKEARIEASLEKVRAGAMSMHHQGDLLEICEIIYTEFQHLGFPELRNAMINIHDDENETLVNYDYSDAIGKTTNHLTYDIHPVIEKQIREIRRTNDAFSKTVFAGKDLLDWKKFRKKIGEKDDPRITRTKALYYYFYSIGNGAIGISTFSEISDEKLILLKRFRNVFHLAYQRYTDIALAEAQAKEARIELALERVRARAMAMRESAELGLLIFEMYQELTKLDAQLDRCFIMIVDPETKGITWWLAGKEGLLAENGFFIPMNQHPTHLMYLDCWRERKKKWQYLFEGKEKRDWDRFGFIKTELAKLPEYIKKDMAGVKKIHLSGSSEAFGNLVTGSLEPLPEEHQDIISRFTIVFNQSYTRFLDLQKAEAQARESQIQLALERVRARTMAMQRSEELQETSLVLFQQLKVLGEPAEQCTIGIIKESEAVVEISATFHGNKMQQTFRHKIDEPFVMSKLFRGWKGQQKTLVLEIKERELQLYNQYRNELTGKEIFPVQLLPGDRWIIHVAYFSAGMLALSTNEPRPAESLQILERFANVFEQAYTRFLDLLKAEAQAREAQIEAALERVRSRSMGMQKSDELKEVIQVVYEQFVHLNIPVEHTGFVMDYKTRDDHYIWIADHNGAPSQVTIPYFDCAYYNRFKEAKEKGDDFFVTHLSFEEKNSFYQQLFEYVPGLPEDARKFYFSCPGLAASTVLLENIGLYIENFSGIPFTDEDNNILMRFGKVFQQTYTRFLDLQKAEVQAKEAKIEAALEKVRSRSLAMHNSGELREVVAVVFEKLQELNFSIDGAAFIMTFTEGSKDSNLWICDDKGRTYPNSFTLPYNESPLIKDIWEAGEAGIDFLSKTYDFEEKNRWFRYVFEHTEIKILPDELKNWILEQPCLTQSFAMGKNSVIGIHFHHQKTLSDTQNDILKRFSKVFDQAYIRFLDLQKSEAQAREAQIEAALERVRGRAMAMHKSDELLEAGELLYRELSKLGIEKLTSGYVLMDDEEKIGWNYGVNPATGTIMPQPIGLIHTETSVMKSIAESWKKQEPYHLIKLDPQATIEHQAYIATSSINYPYTKEKLLSISPERLAIHAFNFKQGYLLIVGGSELTADQREMVTRFTKVFEMTFRRFLDLKQAEAQAKEAQIELGLERVRARAMAMQSSDELKELIGTVFTELTKLDLALTRCIIWVFEPSTDAAQWWMANSEEPSNPMSVYLHYHEHPAYLTFLREWKKQNVKFVYDLNGADKIAWDEILFDETELKQLPDVVKEGMRAPERVLLSASFNNFGGINVASLEPLSDEHFDILLRFAKVFDLTYTRFNDLQKAEAQAREAQIQLAMERIRARTMAMQNSNELKDAAALLFQQVKSLGAPAYSCGYNIWEKDDHEFTSWMSTQDGSIINGVPNIPLTEDANFIRYVESKQNDEQFFVLELRDERMQEHYQYLKTIPAFKAYFDYAVSVGFDLPETQIHHLANFSQGNLLFITLEPCPEFHDVFKRFAAVFEQTYTRFLDLQKAEAQAREVRIEMALERVRSRTMAMHKSDELAETATVLFEQFNELGESPERIAIGIMNEEEQVIETWATLHGGTQMDLLFKFTIEEPHVMQKMYRAWKQKEKHITIDLQGAALDEYFEFLKNAGAPVKREVFGERRIQNVAFFSKGMLTIITPELRPAETIDLLKRFAGVFDLTYTRFLDLKQAEAQAKEARIETSLERVRSKTMAMHNSQDVAATVVSLFDELVKLGIDKSIRCGIGILNDSPSMELWTASYGANGEVTLNIGKLDLDIHPLLQGMQTAWKNKEAGYTYELMGRDLVDYYSAISNAPDYHFHIDINTLPERVVHNDFFFPDGTLYAFTREALPAETAVIMKRFAAVFGQTYRRYLDLQKAEAQARESHIEAALEKVRSRTLAMQKSDELSGTAAVLFQQLISLGIEPNRLYIILIKENTADMEAWVTDEDGSKVSMGFTGSYQRNGTLLKMYEGWRARRKTLVIDMQGEELQQYFHYLHDELKVPFKGGLEQKRRVQHLAYFSHGLIGMASPDEQPAETMVLLERFTAVFNLTFARFNDLKIAEAHALQSERDLLAIKEAKQKAEEALMVLQATQKQLIQSEKMASLGELTAGIAHEIQNPLNFVNNFSEVSNELLSEMVDEVDKGNTEEVKSIAKDVQQNLEKILHHGKRADAIVKGMLQHSSSGSGKKEPTDINTLADEYLRLAYHGLRAKDKSFNATMKTDFDETIGNINIIPQDIGRVILNLITNAFYVVNEREKLTANSQQLTASSYQPTVSVSTKKAGNKVEIRVADNGNGISQQILDKIFQPFFTTKPTGQGTGLGLSLSYDIVKAHGGELKVETKEGEGSEFIIQLNNW